jgi:hypothetical protein
MNSINVTSEWLNWFYSERIQLITTIDNREMLTKTLKGHIQGDHLNYTMVFKIIEIFLIEFDFLKVDKIRLVWSERLEKENLQFFNQGENFESWKENVLKSNHTFENSFGGDYEDPTELYYNYSIYKQDHNLELYKYGQTDRAAIYLWYNPEMNITNYEINLELRTALFSSDEQFMLQLPDNCIKQNNALLDKAKNHTIEKLKKIENLFLS